VSTVRAERAELAMEVGDVLVRDRGRGEITVDCCERIKAFRHDARDSFEERTDSADARAFGGNLLAQRARCSAFWVMIIRTNLGVEQAEVAA
jgi:hypothetical protein